MNLLDYCVDETWENALYSMVKALNGLDLDEKVAAINDIKLTLHGASPFSTEPVDCVLWVKTDNVESNDYNPNSVAPPEMELLKTSIMHDGYTQPIVTWPKEDDMREVVDGFHRNRVARECEEVGSRVHGYLPVVTIRSEQEDRNDRIASTIRHNRARGKHNVDSMSDIVIELKKRNWSDKRIGKELGMDEDEILRLCQVSGLVEVFQDTEFSKSWDVGIFDDESLSLIDEADIEAEDKSGDRILHQWQDWECYPAGFYEQHPPKDMTVEDCEIAYMKMLSSEQRFEEALSGVLRDWVKSCEHYLSNEKMNRIAWLGQAALCYQHGIPSRFRGGYNLLTDKQKLAADMLALKYLNKWLVSVDRDEVNLDGAGSKAQVNLY